MLTTRHRHKRWTKQIWFISEHVCDAYSRILPGLVVLPRAENDRPLLRLGTATAKTDTAVSTMYQIGKVRTARSFDPLIRSSYYVIGRTAEPHHPQNADRGWLRAMLQAGCMASHPSYVFMGRARDTTRGESKICRAHKADIARTCQARQWPHLQ